MHGWLDVDDDLFFICFLFAQLFRPFNQERRFDKQMKIELIDIAYGYMEVQLWL